MKKVFAILLSVMMVLTMMTSVFAEGETETDEIAALLESCGLTGGTFNANKITAPTDAYLNEAGQLVVDCGTKKGGNLHLFADLGALAGRLTDYTVEVKMTGVTVDDTWHYGIGINNKADGSMVTYFTMRSGAYASGSKAGQLMCYFKTPGNPTQYVDGYLGKPDTAFANMSAAVGVTNVLSVTYNSNEKTMTYKVNGVEIKALKNAGADMTLKDLSLVVPHGTPTAHEVVAFSYLKVMDADGNVVYNNDFTNSFEYVGTAIRFNEPSGIRVKTSISESLRTATIAEDGFKVVEYGTLVALGNAYAEAGMTVGAAGVHKAIAYSAANGTDTFFSRDAEKTEYTVVLHNITDVNQQYAFRAYYVVEYADGSTQTVYQSYGDSVNLIKTLSGVAQQIKDANGADYANNQEFIDNVLASAAA